ncbi:hypothetical protein D9619_006762 [Psilocybe cf. subviscida]|uniref:Ricin B lectin domain-containing protein n=1 Tax=Psilocybe cf. subviscida TaxID=2480587 RepID=A0A8H5B5C3_9AGAR|nr:hypothetical protein D9619_006762 [Psilocybe cf. subviscida]
MKAFTASVLAAIVALKVNALGIPTGDTVSQIQPPPGTRGTLPRTPCLAVITAQNNQSVIIDDCTAETELRAFRVTNGGSTTGAGPAGPIVLFNTLCLEPAGPIASGTKVQINACDATKPSQNWQWNSNGTVNIAGSNQCLDLTDGNLSNGIQMQIFACSLGNKNQIWSANTLQNPIREVAALNNGLTCIGANSSANGSPVFSISCLDNNTRKVWSVPQLGHGNHGAFKLAFGDFDGSAPIKCLDVTNGVSAPGTKLQLWDCVTNSANQDFFPTLSNTIQWEGSNVTAPGLCISGASTTGQQLQLQRCSLTDGNQLWSENVPPPTTI